MYVRLGVSPAGSHVGMVVYARGVQTLLDLPEGGTSESLVSCFTYKLQASPNCEVHTGLALHRAAEMFRRGARTKCGKRLLLITNESSYYQGYAILKAAELKKIGVEITAIGRMQCFLQVLLSI